jgi:serine/threonine protein phosphatase PrpC
MSVFGVFDGHGGKEVSLFVKVGIRDRVWVSFKLRRV